MLKKISFLLFFISIVFANNKENIKISSPENIASSYYENLLIGDIISPISGQIYLSKIDLISKGAQNIYLKRFYMPPYIPQSFHKKRDWNEVYLYKHLQGNYKGWIFLSHLKLQGSYNKLKITDQNGITLEFQVSGSDTTLVGDSYGINNVIGDIPSGKYDPRNTKAIISKDRTSIIVHLPDGGVRYYKYRKEINLYNFFGNLEKEILPNGKIIRYKYDKFNRLILIESLDPSEKHVYASLKISNNECFRKFTASSNISAKYFYDRRELNKKIKEKKKRSKIFLKSPLILSKISSPFYRNETINYDNTFLLDKYSSENSFMCSYRPFGSNNPHYRVDTVSFLQNEKDSFLPLYEINYDPPIAGVKNGKTIAKNKNGTSIVYHFSKNFLITSIEYYDKNKILRKKKNFFWTKNNFLDSVEIKDGNNKLFYKKSYQYDSFGNPIKEILRGNLTGKGILESYVITREYSKDGKNLGARHLLLKEKNEDGLITTYTYLKNTNLITSKILKDSKNNFYIREFYEYDDCNNLIKKIIDDGISLDKDNLKNVKERKITSYILKKQNPYLHMVEWIEEKYLENGKEKLLQKKHFFYDRYGNVSKEDIYEASNNFRYSIYREYNERGNLLSKINPMGQKKIYSYDDKGRLIKSLNFSKKLLKERKYDERNNLVEKRKFSKSEDIEHKTSYEYDLNDNLVKKIDFLENSTFYEYDAISKKLIKIRYPSIISENGFEKKVITLYQYDVLGRKISKRDGNGFFIYYKYNAYGSLQEIIYPNSSKEKFSYYKNGLLKAHQGHFIKKSF